MDPALAMLLAASSWASLLLQQAAERRFLGYVTAFPASTKLNHLIRRMPGKDAS